VRFVEFSKADTYGIYFTSDYSRFYKGFNSLNLECLLKLVGKVERFYSKFLIVSSNLTFSKAYVIELKLLILLSLCCSFDTVKLFSDGFESSS